MKWALLAPAVMVALAGCQHKPTLEEKSVAELLVMVDEGTKTWQSSDMRDGR